MYSGNAHRVDLLKTVTSFFREEYGVGPDVVASAPGRLDFLNTHQDYKGLPVVSVAINKRMYIAISESSGISRVTSVNLRLENMPYRDVFKSSNPGLGEKGFFGNYVRSVVIALREMGFDIGDFNVLIYSEIPVASGLASSAALQVSLLTALNELYSLKLSRRDIAEIAYHSERDVMGIPCGRLDQYGSVMGGITRINTKPPYETKTYMDYEWYFTVLYSGIKHSTALIHPKRISEIENALSKLTGSENTPLGLKSKLSRKIDEVKWGDLSIDEIEPYLSLLDPVEANRLVFTIKMNKSTEFALKALETRGSSESLRALREFLLDECTYCLRSIEETGDLLELISGIVNYQHVLLRDLYDVSLPELELIRDRALGAGALGVKISGAGMGGSLLAIVDSREKAMRVAEYTRDVTKGSWPVEVDEGARVEESKK